MQPSMQARKPQGERPRYDRKLQEMRELHQRMPHRGGAHGSAVAREVLALAVRAPVHAPAPARPCPRACLRCRRGAGHARDGHADLGVRVRQRALGHGAGHGLAHGAVLVDQRGGHAQHLGLGGVGIGDKAALKPLAGARQLGAGGGDQAARAAFGRGQHLAWVSRRIRNISQIGH